MSHSDTINKASQHLSSRPNNPNSLAQPTSHSARTTAMLVTLASVLLVVASAGFGMLFAWQVGSRHDLTLGILSVAMAAGLELSKPFAISSAFAALRSWRVITATSLLLVGLLAIGYSLQAELTFMSMTRGDLVAERASVRDAAQRAASRYQKAEADLAALKPSGTTKSATAVYLERREALQNELNQAEHERQSAPVISVADPGGCRAGGLCRRVGRQDRRSTARAVAPPCRRVGVGDRPRILRGAGKIG
jgi:hypothetical protein